jgi:hypothetical protein
MATATDRPTATRKRIKTTWEMRTYDVWGNAQDGWEVNDSYSHGEVTLWATVETHNVGTPHEFTSASLSDWTVRRAFGLGARIDTDGDDVNYYVTIRRNGYPYGELHCTSHTSLSPIRPA